MAAAPASPSPSAPRNEAVTSDPVAVLRIVSKTYGEVQALRDVELALPRGAVGLLGPNGAGKSTLFRLLLGLEPPDAGTVDVLGRAMPDHSLDVLARVGYMPEDDSLFPGLHGLDQVVHAAQLCGLSPTDARSRAHRALDLCGLADARYRMGAAYSLGMRQRLRLAMAVVHGPDLLILDEPTAGLDPEGRKQMLGLIREIADQGVAVVLSTHVLPDVEAVCDHVVLLSRGQIGYIGSVDGFRQGLGSRWKVRVVGDAGALAAVCRAAGFDSEVEGRSVVVAAPADAGGRLWQLCVEAGVGVRAFGTVEEDMGAAFVRHLRIDDPLRRQGARAEAK